MYWAGKKPKTQKQRKLEECSPVYVFQFSSSMAVLLYKVLRKAFLHNPFYYLCFIILRKYAKKYLSLPAELCFSYRSYFLFIKLVRTFIRQFSPRFAFKNPQFYVNNTVRNIVKTNYLCKIKCVILLLFLLNYLIKVIHAIGQALKVPLIKTNWCTNFSPCTNYKC